MPCIGARSILKTYTRREDQERRGGKHTNISEGQVDLSDNKVKEGGDLCIGEGQ